MTGRIAIITGGLTGIGLACAKALSDAGHRVAVGSRRVESSDSDAARAALGDAAFFHPMDVADEGSVADFMAAVQKSLGDPGILVNAAGIYLEADLTDPDTESWNRQIDINLTGPYLTTRAVMPGMIRAGFGRIVNIASTAGRVGAAGYAGYCASKAGLIGLSKVTAVEGAPHNISCVSISPTWVETPMMDNATVRHSKEAGTSVDKAKEALKGSNPQGRLVQPQEIAALMAFCCGEACPALTNEDIQINAGAMW